jgi:hypothetical protein
MNIQIINPTEYPQWDNLLLTNHQSSFFLTTAWAKVICESYNYKPLYFVVIKDGKLISLMPLIEIKSFLTGKRGVSLPFTDEAPCFFASKDHYTAFINSLLRYGHQAGWNYIEMRWTSRYLSRTPFNFSYFTHSIDLTQGKNNIFKNFRSSNKRNIRKAQKEHLYVHISDSIKSLKSFYKLNCKTRKLHGLPPQPWHFFERIFKYIISSNKGIVVIVSNQKKVIAGAVYFHFRNNAIYKYGASEKTFQHLRPNNLVMWKAIKWYCRNGYATLSLGRTDERNKGLLQFKRGWNTKEEKLYYYKYDLKKEYFVKNNKVKSSYNLFKIMPLNLLKFTGNIFYRHVG